MDVATWVQVSQDDGWQKLLQKSGGQRSEQLLQPPPRSTAATPQAEASLGPSAAPLRGTLTDCIGYLVCVSGHYSLTSLPKPVCQLQALPAAKASPSPSEAGRDGGAASPSAGWAAGASGEGLRGTSLKNPEGAGAWNPFPTALSVVLNALGGRKCFEPGKPSKPSKPSWASGLGQSAVASRVWHCWQHFWGRCEGWDVLPHVLLLL